MFDSPKVYLKIDYYKYMLRLNKYNKTQKDYLTIPEDAKIYPAMIRLYLLARMKERGRADLRKLAYKIENEKAYLEKTESFISLENKYKFIYYSFYGKNIKYLKETLENIRKHSFEEAAIDEHFSFESDFNSFDQLLLRVDNMGYDMVNFRILRNNHLTFEKLFLIKQIGRPIKLRKIKRFSKLRLGEIRKRLKIIHYNYLQKYDCIENLEINLKIKNYNRYSAFYSGTPFINFFMNKGDRFYYYNKFLFRNNKNNLLNNFIISKCKYNTIELFYRKNYFIQTVLCRIYRPIYLYDKKNILDYLNNKILLFNTNLIKNISYLQNKFFFNKIDDEFLQKINFLANMKLNILLKNLFKRHKLLNYTYVLPSEELLKNLLCKLKKKQLDEIVLKYPEKKNRVNRWLAYRNAVKKLLYEKYYHKRYLIGKVTLTQRYISLIFFFKKQYFLLKRNFFYIISLFIKNLLLNITNEINFLLERESRFNNRFISLIDKLNKFFNEKFFLSYEAKNDIVNKSNSFIIKNNFLKPIIFLDSISINLEYGCVRTVFNIVDKNPNFSDVLLEYYIKKLEYHELNYFQKILINLYNSKYGEFFCNYFGLIYKNELNFYDRILTNDSIKNYHEYSERKYSYFYRTLFVERIRLRFAKIFYKYNEFKFNKKNSIKNLIKIFFMPFHDINFLFSYYANMKNELLFINEKIYNAILWVIGYIRWYYNIFIDIMRYDYEDNIRAQFMYFWYAVIVGIKQIPTRGILGSFFGYLTFVDYMSYILTSLFDFYYLRFTVFIDKFWWWISPHVHFWLLNFWIFRHYFLYEIFYLTWYFITGYFIFDYLYHKHLYYNYYLVQYRKIYVDKDYNWSCKSTDNNSILFAKYVQFNHERLITFDRWLTWINYDKPRIYFNKFMLFFLNFLLLIIRKYFFTEVYIYTAYFLERINKLSTVLVDIVIYMNKLDDLGWDFYEYVYKKLYIKLPYNWVLYWHSSTIELKGIIKTIFYTPIYILIIILQIFFISINFIILLLPLLVICIDMLVESYYNYLTEVSKISPYAGSKEHYEKFYMPRTLTYYKQHFKQPYSYLMKATHTEPLTRHLREKEYNAATFLDNYDERKGNMYFRTFLNTGDLREKQLLRIRYINDSFKIKKAFLGDQTRFYLKPEWYEKKLLPKYIYTPFPPLDDNYPFYLFPNSIYYPTEYGQYGSKISPQDRSTALDLNNRFSHYYYITSKPLMYKSLYDYVPNYWYDREIDDMIEDDFESTSFDMDDAVEPIEHHYTMVDKRRPFMDSGYYDSMELEEQTYWAQYCYESYHKTIRDLTTKYYEDFEQEDGTRRLRFYEFNPVKYKDPYDPYRDERVLKNRSLYYSYDEILQQDFKEFHKILRNEAADIKYKLPEFKNVAFDFQLMNEVRFNNTEFFYEHNFFKKQWYKLRQFLNNKYQVTDKINKEIDDKKYISNELKIYLKNFYKSYDSNNLKKTTSNKVKDKFDKETKLFYYENNKYSFKTLKEALKILEDRYKIKVNLESREDIENLKKNLLKDTYKLRLELEKHLNVMLDKLLLLQSKYIKLLKSKNTDIVFKFNLDEYDILNNENTELKKKINVKEKTPKQFLDEYRNSLPKKKNLLNKITQTNLRKMITKLFEQFVDENLKSINKEIIIIKQQLLYLDCDIFSNNLSFKYESILKNINNILFIQKNNLFKNKDQPNKVKLILNKFLELIQEDQLQLMKKLKFIKKVKSQTLFYTKHSIQLDGYTYYHRIYQSQEILFKWKAGTYGLGIFDNFWDWWLEWDIWLEDFSMIWPDSGDYEEAEEDEDDEDEDFDEEEDWYDETDGIYLNWVEDGLDFDDQFDAEDLIGEILEDLNLTYVDKGGYKYKKNQRYFDKELKGAFFIDFFEKFGISLEKFKKHNKKPVILKTNIYKGLIKLINDIKEDSSKGKLLKKLGLRFNYLEKLLERISIFTEKRRKSVKSVKYSEKKKSFIKNLFKDFKLETQDLIEKFTTFEKEVLKGHYFNEDGELDFKKIHIYAETRRQDHFNEVKKLSVDYMKAAEFRRPDKIYIPKGYNDRELEKAQYKKDVKDKKKIYADLAKKGSIMLHRRDMIECRDLMLTSIRQEYNYFPRYFFNSVEAMAYRLHYGGGLLYSELYRIKPFYAVYMKYRKKYPNNPEKATEKLTEIYNKKIEALRKGKVYLIPEEMEQNVPIDIEDILKEQEFVKERDSGKFLF